jgi:hypothetical protein
MKTIAFRHVIPCIFVEICHRFGGIICLHLHGGGIKVNSHIRCRVPALPCRANSHMPFCASAVLRHRRVIRESPCVDGKIRTVNRGIPHSGRKKPNLRRSPTGRQRRPILIHTYHSVPLPCRAVAVRSRLQSGMVEAQQGHGMVCVNEIRSHCVIQMGKTQPNL